MIWLASFPRSGNTFFRNILFEVYGLESSTFHKDPNRKVDKGYDQYPFVKTHLLPHFVTPNFKATEAVYLIRDGRDALVSIAHHKKDIVQPGTDFETNLIQAILAEQGSYFGGWSRNVDLWSKAAKIVIRYEDLIKDPLKEVQKINSIRALPKPDIDKLPTFASLKNGNPKYGGKKSKRVGEDFPKLFFRKGIAGGWKNEMSPQLEHLFWVHHGHTMKQFDYQPSQQVEDKIKHKKKKRILIEAKKMTNPYVDGIGRYLLELTNHFKILLKHQDDWEIDLLINNEITPLILTEKKNITKKFDTDHSYEDKLLVFKGMVKEALPQSLFDIARKLYSAGPFRKALNTIKNTFTKRKVSLIKVKLHDSITKYDIIHSPYPNAILKTHKIQGRHLVTIHDTTHISHPQFHTPENVSNNKESHKILENLDTHYIAVSNNTKKDFLSNFNTPESKFETIYEGVNTEIFHKKNRSKKSGDLNKKYSIPNEDFILCLSTIEPRKNILNTIKAFKKFKSENKNYKTKLVIAGRKGWKFEDVFNEIQLDENDITFTGFIEESDLPYVYAQAKAFAYVSHYEGFGLPLIEAMASGTPVIYGDNSAPKELIGDKGIGVDPNNIDHIKDAIFDLCSNQEKWQHLSTNGWRHAQQFSWLKTAFHTLNYYDKIISEN